MRERRAAPHLSLFFHSFLDFFHALPGTAKRFWALVVLTGVISGLGAVGLIAVLRLVQALVWGRGGSYLAAVLGARRWVRVAAPVAGGVLVTIVSLAWRRPLGGHGTAGIIEAIWVKAGRLPFVRALVRAVVSITAVALGVSLGREGALIQTGAATGSALAARLRIGDDQARLLVACGAAAGFAAVYNVPIGGALFGLEVLLGSFALELFGPIVVSCVTATVISRVLVADHPSYLIPHYQMLGVRVLLLDLAFAPVVGVVSALYIRVIDGTAGVMDRMPRRFAWLWPPLGTLALGIVALSLPQVLGNGYDTVDAALNGALPLALLLALPLVKLGMTALCSAVGIPGGLFTRSLFVGALVGGALGVLAHRISPGVAPTGAFALLGMAGILAGTTHAAVSTVIIVFEMTGDYEAILPLMLMCVVAAAVSRRLERESLYTAALRRRNVALPEPPRPHWLQRQRVADFIEAGPPPVTVVPGATFASLVAKLLLLDAGHDLYVTGDGGRLLGVILLDEIKRHLGDEANLEMIVAADVMSDVTPVTPDTPLYALTRRFAATDLERLPVVESATQRLIGTVSKREVFGLPSY